MGCVQPSSQVVATDFHDCYRLGVKLGRGAFAQVRAATPANRTATESKEVAVKIIDLRGKGESKKEWDKLEKSAINEASSWRRARGCKHVVNLYNVFHNRGLCYFVMEKCATSLFEHIESLTEIDERAIGSIILQMLLGVAHVHRAGIVHRDVKPNNFMVGGSDGTVVKLCDFGVSVRIPQNGKLLKGYAGTAPFMSPEMLEDTLYDDRTDVWSIGVIAYVFLFGGFPYMPRVKDCKAMKEAIIAGEPPKFRPIDSTTSSEERSTQATHFACRLLERDPEKRPSADSALRLGYMVATKSKKHMLGCKLPSLRSTIVAAKKSGAFDSLDKTRKDGLDDILNTLQVVRYGKPLPDAVSETDQRNNVSVLKSGTGRLKVWQDLPSLDTTVSLGNSSPIGSSCPSRLSSKSSVAESSQPCALPFVPSREPDRNQSAAHHIANAMIVAAC